MNFEAYANDKRAAYATFAKTVASILELAIRAERGLRLQHVQHRAKDPASLKIKLEARNCLATEKLAIDIKDLAGCRLVFYTNSDVSRFQDSGIIRSNFEIDWDRTKIHYPRPDSGAAELFVSHNYVVALKDSRTELAEYANYRDMWCEVQIQTSLNHAWSEMAHDTIYKKPKLEGFGAKLFQGIEERMRTIMHQNLLPAGYEFQKVVDDFERLSAGKVLFDQGALQALADCDNNNTRYDLLQRFANSVLPHYDDVQSVYPEIRVRIVAAVRDARETPARAIETPFGEMSGHTVDQVVGTAANILDRLRYIDVEATFDAICELFPGAQSGAETKRLLQSAGRLSAHERAVWEQAGPAVQSTLVRKVLDLDDELLGPLAPVLLEILTQVLKPVVTGTSSTYKSVTFYTGPVTISDPLVRARAGAIAALKRLFHNATTDGDRGAVVKAFSASTATPNKGSYSDDLLAAILESSREIVDFYTEISGGRSYEFLQDLEHRVFFLHRRNRDLQATTLTDSKVMAARNKLTECIHVFRDQVNKDVDFVIYKTLVGFKSVFSPAWDNDDFDFGEKKAYRARRFIEFIEDVDESTSDGWLRTLKRCARTESNDGATFMSFRDFLEHLGRVKPLIVLNYLDQLDEPLAKFLPPMLGSIADTTHEPALRAKILQWVNEGAYLYQIAWYLSHAKQFDLDLLERTSRAAIERTDDNAVLAVLAAAVEQYKKSYRSLIDTIFFPVFRYLQERNERRWIDVVGYIPNFEPLILDLHSSQSQELLEGLVNINRIEYHGARILSSIARDGPEKVVDFFGDRLKHSEASDVSKEYEVVPFDLYDLPVALAKIPNYLVESARNWFIGGDPLFEFNGGRLFQTTFPKFSDALIGKFISIVRSGDDNDIRFVIAVLRSYRGQPFLHDVAKEVVEALEPESQLLSEVHVALEVTGVATGEFGWVSALSDRKSEIELWLNDGRKKVEDFAKRRLLSISRQIAAEQQRSEERLERRKREYGAQPDEES